MAVWDFVPTCILFKNDSYDVLRQRKCVFNKRMQPTGRCLRPVQSDRARKFKSQASCGPRRNYQCISAERGCSPDVDVYRF
jgi:hypothetical protein